MNTPIVAHLRPARIAAALCLFSGASLLAPDRVAGQTTDNPSAPTATDAVTPLSAATVPSAVENSVVKIFCTIRAPDVYHPWTKGTPQQISGSGVVIEGGHILTNAHVVSYASQIQVQAAHSGEKISAKVELIATGIDLAVLSLDDPTFFDTHPPLPYAPKIPDAKDPVLVYGFPTGGNNLSITKGIVSRIEFVNYNDDVPGLRIQVDAAINPGNSGGPAVVNNQMIGLAFSKLINAQNIGYIIPGEEIDLFLKDLPSGHYSGKPVIYDETQFFENPALHSFLKTAPSVHGILVYKPFFNDPAYPLKKWDVITKIGDTAINDRGMVDIGNNLSVDFHYLIQKVAKDGKVPLTIVRHGQEAAIQFPVETERPRLVPYLKGEYPSYYIFGPLVFSKATGQFFDGLKSLGTAVLSHSPLITRRHDQPAFPGEELVIVSSPLFPHKLGENYGQYPVGCVLKSVNDLPIKNLNQLAQVLNDSKDEYLKFEFDGDYLETLVFPRQAMKDSTEEILSDNDIRSQASPDVLAAISKAAK